MSGLQKNAKVFFSRCLLSILRFILSSRHEKRCRMLEIIFCLFQCSRNRLALETYGEVHDLDKLWPATICRLTCISAHGLIFLHFIMFKAASPAYFSPKFGRNVWKDSDCHLSLLDMSMQWLLEIKDWKTSHCALKYQRQILHCVVDLCNMNLQLHCSTAEILYIRGPKGSTDQALFC